MTNQNIYDQKEIKLVSLYLGEQIFGIPAESVKEILYRQELTQIPLVGEDVIGLFNLRGRIVTAIDIYHILGLEKNVIKNKSVSVIIESKEDLYALIFDEIGEVFNVSTSQIKIPPANLDSQWKNILSGVYRMEKNLLLILDNKNIFNY